MFDVIANLLPDALHENYILLTAVVGASALVAGSAAWSSYGKSEWKPIPGPPKKWIIGNALDVPIYKEWITWEKWKRQYGPILRLEAIGTQVVLLSSPEYISDLLCKRSAVSSNRASFTMCNELVGFEKTVVALNPGPCLRDTRKHFHQTIGGENIHKYDSLIEEEAEKFLRRVTNSEGGDHLKDEIRRAIGAVIIGIIWGAKVDSADDPYIRDAGLVMSHFSQTTQIGQYFVDFIPMLKYVPDWFPGAGFKREAKWMRSNLYSATEKPFQRVKDELAAKIHRNSFCHELLSEPGLTKEKEDIIKWAGVSMYLAGSDTTVAAVHNFFMLMVQHPEVQRKAKEEIVSVLGPGRLPAIRDRSSLPYVEAVVKESLRYPPIVPEGGAHVLTQDEVLDGYFIKKGTICLGNIWGILHDEKYFSNPDRFIPERHLKEGNATGETALLEVNDYVFGFARRICPGKTLADIEVWTIAARALATMDILKPLDENGNEREVMPDWTNGSVNHIIPFDCRILPHSDKTMLMLQI